MQNSRSAVSRERLGENLLLVALCFSLLLHGLAFGTYKLFQVMGWHLPKPPAFLDRIFHPAAPPVVVKAIELQKKRQEEEKKFKEVPLVFVEVDPTQASPDTSKEAKYYSTANSRAANPDITKNLNQPKIDGRQEHVVKTTDVAKSKPKPQPLQKPAPQPAEKPLEQEQPPKETATAEKAVQAKPKGGKTIGDLAMAKPVTQPSPNDGTAESKAGEAQAEARPRPRSLAEARMLHPEEAQKISGEKTKQEGGVPRFATQSTLDVKSTPFAAYDQFIIAAIQQRWYDLLEERQAVLNRQGRVVIEFKLHSDGRVTDVTIAEENVGDLLSLLCQRAVIDPAKYPKWPSDMRRMIGEDFREVRFTFYYN